MFNTTGKIFADPLTRDFVPCSRVIAFEAASGIECLPGCTVLRTFPANDFPGCRIEKGGFILIDFGKELSGGIRIVTSGEMTFSRIRIRFGESCSEAMNDPNQDHALHDTELTLPRYSSIDFGNTGFRFVRIDVLDEPLEVHNIIAIFERRKYPVIGTFRSSDELLNEIYDTCVHTIQLNMQDYIYDGVKRDRLVWGGDLNPEAMVILRVFGDVPVLRDTLELLRTHTPKDSFINDFSSYSLWYFITLHDHWFHSGDDSLLKANQEYLEKETHRFIAMVNPDGSEQLPPTRFLDWPSNDSPDIIHAGLQGLLLMGLRALNEMLAALHSTISIPDNVFQRLKTHVPDPVNSKAAASLQILSGLADRTDVMEKDPFKNVSTYFGYYMLLAKQNQAALDLVRNYWGAMLKLGATSFWEDFSLDWVPGATSIDELPVSGRPDIHKDFGAYCYKGLRHSLCHGWSAGPAAWCSQKILGIEPLQPGFKEISFRPDLCDLEFVKGTVPTPYGSIAVSLEKGHAPEIQIPKGISLKKGKYLE